MRGPLNGNRSMSTRTLYDKIWDAHFVTDRSDGMSVIYIDQHLLHEVTSPQAFQGLRLAGRKPWRIDANLATPDHNVPTSASERAAGIDGIADEVARLQVRTLDANCDEFGISEFKINDVRQGIVHVIGPEQGATLPGMTIVCGDSHTSTHGAFAALAQGIGTSEVEHVLATQCLVQQKSDNMRVTIDGQLPAGVSAKDLVLALIAQIGTAGATEHVIEFTGSAVEKLSMEGRMTLCNMSVEAGGRAGLVAVDETTIEYVAQRPLAPKGVAWDKALEYWVTLTSDANASFNREVRLDAGELGPQVSWGTSPELVVGIDDYVPDPTSFSDPVKAELAMRALSYMDLQPGIAMKEIKMDKVFIGSCTNGRIEDLREAAAVVKGRTVRVDQALVVPGSGLVKEQAEREGLHQVFLDAGFEWRAPGCSMCLAMNADRLYSGERCASTSNRNFEGRQGYGGRTHLVSPATAAATAVSGFLSDHRELT